MGILGAFVSTVQSTAEPLAARIEQRVEREQRARARGFGRVLMAITAGAALVSLAVGGAYTPLRWAWLGALLFLFVVSAVVVSTVRGAGGQHRRRILWFGFAAVVAGLLSSAYLGVFSPVPLVVTTGIAFFGQARTPLINRGVSVSVISGAFVMMVIFSLEPSWDPGMVSAADIDPGWRAFFTAMVPFVMLTTWWQARVELTARLQRIDELSEALERAEFAMQTKSRFLANMSHEIRTPLNGISGMAALLANEAREAHNIERIEIIRDSANALLRILNDVLDTAQLEAGELRIEPEAFDLLAVVDGVIGTLGPAARAKGVELVSTIDPATEGERMGDEGRIRQILLNLVHNGIKFTDAGFVHVDVRPSRDDQVAFVVRDTGSGISAELRDEVFEPFTQVDDSKQRRHGGSGLGLSIARKLAERMGGSLSVETTLGLGSSFALRVPLPRCEDVSAPQWQELRGLRVHVDLPDGKLAWALRTWFTDRGARVVAATRASVVLRPFTTAQGEPRLRLEGGEVRLATSVGLPVRWSRLHDAVVAALSGSSQAASRRVEHATGAQTLDGVVLVVDDNEVNLMVARGMLEAAGARVLTATSASEARDAIDTPDLRLIVMDVQMPELDGVAFTRELRQSGVELPIVGLTAHADERARARCFEAGMNAHLAKPVKQQVLLETVAALVAGTFARPAPGQPDAADSR